MGVADTPISGKVGLHLAAALSNFLLPAELVEVAWPDNLTVVSRLLVR